MLVSSRHLDSTLTATNNNQQQQQPTAVNSSQQLITADNNMKTPEDSRKKCACRSHLPERHDHVHRLVSVALARLVQGLAQLVRVGLVTHFEHVLLGHVAEPAVRRLGWSYAIVKMSRGKEGYARVV